jgi:hypothetical protein
MPVQQPLLGQMDHMIRILHPKIPAPRLPQLQPLDSVTMDGLIFPFKWSLLAPESNQEMK